MKFIAILIFSLIGTNTYSQSLVGLKKSEIIQFHESKGLTFNAEDKSASLLSVVDSTNGDKIIYIYYFNKDNICTSMNMAFPRSYLNHIIKSMDKLAVRERDFMWIDYTNGIRYVLDEEAQRDYGYFQILSNRYTQ